MKIPQKKAVSPIIATLLLIAITVAAGVVVYVFVGGLSSSLSKSGGNQVTESLSQDAYTSATGSNSTIYLTLRNVGSGAVTISNVYLDGTVLAANGTPATKSVAATSTISLSMAQTFGHSGATSIPEYSMTGSLTAGTSHQVKVVTLDGAIFTFNVVAGSSG